MLVRTAEDIDRALQSVREAARAAQEWFLAQTGDPLTVMRRIKFDQVGRHPIADRPLNFIEQVNQTWTFLAALLAARQLLALHPDAGGFWLAPGAHASQDLDVMSEVEGAVGAEAFAAVDPANNRKLANDLRKLAGRGERHRYVFFISPRYPGFQRLPLLESGGVQVWSIDVP
jgi:hypothetical protein